MWRPAPYPAATYQNRISKELRAARRHSMEHLAGELRRSRPTGTTRATGELLRSRSLTQQQNSRDTASQVHRRAQYRYANRLTDQTEVPPEKSSHASGTDNWTRARYGMPTSCRESTTYWSGCATPDIYPSWSLRIGTGRSH